MADQAAADDEFGSLVTVGIANPMSCTYVLLFCGQVEHVTLWTDHESLSVASESSEYRSAMAELANFINRRPSTQAMEVLLTVKPE
jgi:hypothetical protein